MTLSELIRYYRASEHLSLEAIGDYVGVAKSTVKRWESGAVSYTHLQHIPFHTSSNCGYFGNTFFINFCYD